MTHSPDGKPTLISKDYWDLISSKKIPLHCFSISLSGVGTHIKRVQCQDAASEPRVSPVRYTENLTGKSEPKQISLLSRLRQLLCAVESQEARISFGKMQRTWVHDCQNLSWRFPLFSPNVGPARLVLRRLAGVEVIRSVLLAFGTAEIRTHEESQVNEKCLVVRNACRGSQEHKEVTQGVRRSHPSSLFTETQKYPVIHRRGYSGITGPTTKLIPNALPVLIGRISGRCG